MLGLFDISDSERVCRPILRDTKTPRTPSKNAKQDTDLGGDDCEEYEVYFSDKVAAAHA